MQRESSKSFFLGCLSYLFFCFGNSDYSTTSGGYWTAPPSEAPTTTKHIKPHNKRYSKVNVPVRVSAPLATTVVETAPPTLDANKRKQLPAWIREGKIFDY